MVLTVIQNEKNGYCTKLCSWLFGMEENHCQVVPVSMIPCTLASYLVWKRKCTHEGTNRTSILAHEPWNAHFIFYSIDPTTIRWDFPITTPLFFSVGRRIFSRHYAKGKKKKKCNPVAVTLGCPPREAELRKWAMALTLLIPTKNRKINKLVVHQNHAYHRALCAYSWLSYITVEGPTSTGSIVESIVCPSGCTCRRSMPFTWATITKGEQRMASMKHNNLWESNTYTMKACTSISSNALKKRELGDRRRADSRVRSYQSSWPSQTLWLIWTSLAI